MSPALVRGFIKKGKEWALPWFPDRSLHSSEPGPRLLRAQAELVCRGTIPALARRAAPTPMAEKRASEWASGASSASTVQMSSSMPIARQASQDVHEAGASPRGTIQALCRRDQVQAAGARVHVGHECFMRLAQAFPDTDGRWSTRAGHKDSRLLSIGLGLILTLATT